MSDHQTNKRLPAQDYTPVIDEDISLARLLLSDELEAKDAEIERLRERVAYLEKAFLTGKRPI